MAHRPAAMPASPSYNLVVAFSPISIRIEMGENATTKLYEGEAGMAAGL